MSWEPQGKAVNRYISLTDRIIAVSARNNMILQRIMHLICIFFEQTVRTGLTLWGKRPLLSDY